MIPRYCGSPRQNWNVKLSVSQSTPGQMEAVIKFEFHKLSASSVPSGGRVLEAGRQFRC